MMDEPARRATTTSPQASGARSDARGEAITATLLAQWLLPAPDAAGDKETRGRVLIIGGDARVPGGAILAGTAALRVGAGRLQIAVAAPVAAATGVAVPEARVEALPILPHGAPDPNQIDHLEELCRRAGAVVIGPGLLDPEAAGALVDRVAGWIDRAALVVDAAALAGVTENLGGRLEDRLIVTPNVGEAAKLLDWPDERVADMPDEAALAAAARYRAVVALKGRATRVADRAGCLYVNHAGNVGLAVSGSGDVLAGLVGGLAARGAPLVQATAWAVHLHALAADDLASRVGTLGYLPREIPGRVPSLLVRLDGQDSARRAG